MRTREIDEEDINETFNENWTLRLTCILYDPREESHDNTHYAARRHDKPEGVMIELTYPLEEKESNEYRYDKEVEEAAKDLKTRYPDIINIEDDFSHGYYDDERGVRLYLDKMPNEDQLQNILNDFVNLILQKEGLKDVSICSYADSGNNLAENAIIAFKEDMKELEIPGIPKETTSFSDLYSEYWMKENSKKINIYDDVDSDSNFSESDDVLENPIEEDKKIKNLNTSDIDNKRRLETTEEKSKKLHVDYDSFEDELDKPSTSYIKEDSSPSKEDKEVQEIIKNNNIASRF